MQLPPQLEKITLLKSAKSFTYSSCRKGCKWKERKAKSIINVFPKFYTIPKEELEHYETFCWSELLLYKNFGDIEIDIGLTKDTIIKIWKKMNTNKYDV